MYILYTLSYNIHKLALYTKIVDYDFGSGWCAWTPWQWSPNSKLVFSHLLHSILQVSKPTFPATKKLIDCTGNSEISCHHKWPTKLGITLWPNTHARKSTAQTQGAKMAHYSHVSPPQQQWHCHGNWDQRANNLLSAQAMVWNRQCYSATSPSWKASGADKLRSISRLLLLTELVQNWFHY
jgi:hypothetical protein